MRRMPMMMLWSLIGTLLVVALLPIASTARAQQEGSSVPTSVVAYKIKNPATGRYLDADSFGDVAGSLDPATADSWFMLDADGGGVLLRNSDLSSFLDIDPTVGQIDLSVVAYPDDVWVIDSVEGTNNIEIRSALSGQLLTQVGADIVATDRTATPDQRWSLIEAPTLPPSPFAGQRVALQNGQTTRWLDIDIGRDGDVNQSRRQSGDDVWLIEDAGNGYVRLVSEMAGSALVADFEFADIETSSQPTVGDQWAIEQADGQLMIRNVRFGGYLNGQSAETDFNVTRSLELSAATSWSIAPLSNVSSLAIGTVVEGELEGPGDLDTYAFGIPSGGQAIFVDVETCFGGIPRWELRDADDQIIANAECHPSVHDQTIVLGEGTYFFIMQGDVPAFYSFQLWNVPQANGFDVAVGDTISDGIPGSGAGHIETPGASDDYRFNVADGVTAIGLTWGSCLPENSTSYQLVNGIGEQVAVGTCGDGAVVIALPVGRYTLRVQASSQRLDVTGTYDLQLVGLP